MSDPRVPLSPIERAIKEHKQAAAHTGPANNESIGAIIGELDWTAELAILNAEACEEDRLP